MSATWVVMRSHNDMPVIAQTTVVPEALTELAAKIRAALTV